jgi:hypothetical protein
MFVNFNVKEENTTMALFGKTKADEANTVDEREAAETELLESAAKRSTKESNRATAEETSTRQAPRRQPRNAAPKAGDEVSVSLRMIYENEDGDRVVPFAMADRNTVLFAPEGSGREERMPLREFLDTHKRLDDVPTVGRNI